MTPEEHKEAIDKLQALIDSYQVKHPRASVSDRRSHHPYYTPYYAKNLLPVMQELLKGEKFPMFDCRKMGVAPKTVQAQLNQAWLYLIDNLDDDQKTFYNLRCGHMIATRGSFVIIKKRSQAPAFVTMQTVDEVYEDEESDLEFWDEIEEFFNTCEPGAVWVKEGLKLRKEQVDELEIKFNGLFGANGNGFRWQIKDGLIKIVKI